MSMEIRRCGDEVSLLIPARHVRIQAQLFECLARQAGSDLAAGAWLTRPQGLLGGATPAQYATTAERIKQVIELHGRQLDGLAG